MIRHLIPRGGDGTECRPGCQRCCYDLLSLVMPRPPAQRVISGWTHTEIEQAITWAANVHAKASDNPVRKKPIPEHVRKVAQAMGFTCNEFYVYDLGPLTATRMEKT